MKIEIGYYLWKGKKIAWSRRINLTEEDLIQLLKNQYEDDQLPFPINLSKDEVNPEFSIEQVTI